MFKKKIVDITYAKAEEYAKILKKVIQEGKCPFCPEDFKYHPKPILNKTKNWFITPNTWPYKNARCHFLIIGKKHKKNLNELLLTDWKEIRQLADWAIK